MIGAILVFALLAIFVRPKTPEALLRTSPFGFDKSQTELVFYEVGQASTVSIFRSRGNYRLRTNGLPEAYISSKGFITGFTSESEWMGALPTLCRPKTKSICLIGLGGGSMLNGISSTVESIDVVELEEEVIHANQMLGKLRLSLIHI